MPWGTFQVYIFKSVQNLAYFFTLNIIKIFFTSKGGGGAKPPKYAPGLKNKRTDTSAHPLLYVCPTGDSSSTSAKTGDITQPGSVPDWWVCIQTNVQVGRCLQTHTWLRQRFNCVPEHHARNWEAIELSGNPCWPGNLQTVQRQASRQWHRWRSRCY